MTISEENKGSPLISQTDVEPPDPELPISQTKSDQIDLSEIDKLLPQEKKPIKQFLLYALFSLLGLTILVLSFIFKNHFNKTILIIFYEFGFFLSIPILLIFFEAYHYFLQPMYNSFDDSQEKTELADIGS